MIGGKEYEAKLFLPVPGNAASDARRQPEERITDRKGVLCQKKAQVCIRLCQETGMAANAADTSPSPGVMGPESLDAQERARILCGLE